MLLEPRLDVRPHDVSSSSLDDGSTLLTALPSFASPTSNLNMNVLLTSDRSDSGFVTRASTSTSTLGRPHDVSLE